MNIPTSFGYILLVILLTTLNHPDVRAQQRFSLRGTLSDERSGTPIEGASIIVKGTTNGSTTDAQGRFVIHGLQKGEVTIVVSYVGYLSKEKKLRITADKDELQ